MKIKNAPTMENSSERAQTIITALGGADNLTNVDCCATRLRVSVNDPE